MRVLSAIKSGVTLSEVARRERVSTATIRRWARLYGADDAGTPAPTPTDVARAASPAARGTLPSRLARLAERLPEKEASLVREAIESIEGKHAPVEMPDPSDALAYTQALVRQAQADYERARDINDTTAAKQTLAMIQKLMPTLKTLKRDAVEESGGVVISRAEVETAAATFRERVAALLEKPLHCAACGARVRTSDALAAARASKT